MHKNTLLSLISLLIIVLATGCVPKTYRVHPQLETHLQDINSPSLIPPDIKIYEISAGGVTELIDEWSKAGKDNVHHSVSTTLDSKKCHLIEPAIDDEIKEELEDIQALYRAVVQSIQLHAYGPYLFPEKQKNFEYSVGSIKNILDKTGSDSLIFVYGMDQISTAGRKVLMVLATGLTGADYITAMSGLTLINIALIDSSGNILWYNVNAAKGTYDLRDTESTEKVVKVLLNDFPEMATK
jgi:hypothetical protein